MAAYGFRSQIAGNIKLDVSEHVDKRTLRFMGPGAAYAHIAMEQAINDSGLTEKKCQILELVWCRLRRSIYVRYADRASNCFKEFKPQENWSICCS